MTNKLVTLFGANGFLGRHVIRELVRDGWRIRIATRRPHTAQDLVVNGSVGQIQLMQANIRYMESVERALDGAHAVINLAGIPYKQGRQTFEAIHNVGVQNIANAAKARGITNIVHLSTLSANQKEPLSLLARSKASGDRALQEIVPSADVLRAATIYGHGKGLFRWLSVAASFTPILPLFGGGKTRFSPVYVGDIAQAVATTITRKSTGTTYELAGPNSYSFKEIAQFTLATINKKRLLMPVPWFMGSIMGLFWEIAGAIPVLNLWVKPFVTRDQIKGWKSDESPSGEHAGFSDLDITPETIEAIVPATLESFKKYGQFHQTAPVK